MSKFFQLHDRELDRFNNKPYYRGTWETLKMEPNRLIPFQVKTGTTARFIVYNATTGTIYSKTITTGSHSFSFTPASSYTYYVYASNADHVISYEAEVSIKTTRSGSNLITSWSNNNFNTFTSDDSSITSAVATDTTYRYAVSNGIALTGGTTYRFDVDLTVKSGGSLQVIQVINDVETDISTKFAGLTSTYSDYITYAGGNFSDYITSGRCYFKINNKYSEDVDIMDLNMLDDTVGANFVKSWANNNFNTFTSSAGNITSAISTDTVYRFATSNAIAMKAGIKHRWDISLTVNSGTNARFFIYNATTGIILSKTIGTGSYSYTVTPTSSRNYYIYATNADSIINFSATVALYRLTQDIEFSASEDYLKIMVTSDVDFGGTYYKGDFTQILWKTGTVERGQLGAIEVIGDERNGVIVKEKITTATKYNVKLKVTESEYTAMIEALPGSWTITDTAGKIYTCNNLEISDPEWYNGNGIVTLTFTDNISIYAQNNDDL